MLKTNDIFSKVKGFSGLKIANVFVEEKKPILFTCEDANHNLYLALCPLHDAEHVVWYLARTNHSILLELIENKKTIYDAFKEGESRKYVIVYDRQGISCDYVLFDALDASLLPVQGEFLDVGENEYLDEIAFLLKGI